MMARTASSSWARLLFAAALACAAPACVLEPIDDPDELVDEAQDELGEGEIPEVAGAPGLIDEDRARGDGQEPDPLPWQHHKSGKPTGPCDDDYAVQDPDPLPWYLPATK